MEFIAHNLGVILRIAGIAVGTLFCFWLLSALTGRLLRFIIAVNKVKQADRRVTTISNVLLSTGDFIITLIALLMILKELKIDTSPILASAGIAGLAISFGAQQLIKDIFSGLVILCENQFGEGDRVKLDELTGYVEKLTLRKTILRDDQGNRYHVPHGQIRFVTVFSK